MSKRKLGVIIAASCAMLMGSIALGMSLSKNYNMEFGIGEPEYTVNGTIKEFDKNTEVLPYIDNETGEIMMPLRCVLEEMGGSLGWDEKTQTTSISYKGTKIEIAAGDSMAVINGNSIILKSVPQNVNGTLYVAASFISDNLGTDIQWEQDKNRIVMKSEVSPRPAANRNVLDYNAEHIGYEVQVPVITGLNDGKYEKELNSTLMKERLDQITEYLKENGTTPSLEDNAAKAYWTSEVTFPCRSNEMISILVFNTMQQMDGEVKEWTVTENFDLLRQKKITLGDLFKNEKYEAFLLKEMNTAIKENPDSYTGVKPTEFSLEEEVPFYFEGKDIVLLKKMEDGTTEEFRIPVIELKKFLKDDYKILISND